MKTVWKLLNSRAVVPVKASCIATEYANGEVRAYGKDEHDPLGRNIFKNREDAIAKAEKLISRSEHQAQLMLLNAKKHRLNLELSIKEYNA